MLLAYICALGIFACHNCHSEFQIILGYTAVQIVFQPHLELNWFKQISTLPIYGSIGGFVYCALHHFRRNESHKLWLRLGVSNHQISF